jgi:small subunit ribosomal protein S13
MYISGHKLNENKRICDALQKIYGIGKSKAKQIVCILGFKLNIRLKEIEYTEQLKLDRMLIHYIHGFRAKREKKDNILILKDNKSYRGIRHDYFLSVRGQRTRTNAKTQRNKKNAKKNKTGKNKIKK